MAKVTGSYDSVVRGVSEQVPQDRRDGQHYEQINLVSDPVRGLARRHGSVMQDEVITGAYTESTFNKMLVDSASHKTFTFFVEGVEYDVCYRSKADTQSLGTSNFAYCFNRQTREFLPVVLGAGMSGYTSGGVSSMVNVGKYVFVSGNTVAPTYTATDKWAATSNKRNMVAWIKDGKFSRTYTITLIRPDGTTLTRSHTTPSASYPNLLDTSDIDYSDPDYQKQVNDRVNAYNGAVTAWIGTSTAAIQPERIADALQDLFIGAGVSCNSDGGSILFDDVNFSEIAVEDNGDGTLLIGVGAEVANIDLVSRVHYPGKIVRVRPKKNNALDALYLMAVAKNPSGVAGWAEVTWKEVAGYEMKPVAPFAIATIKAGTFYIAGTPADLQTLVTDPVPQFKVNEVGDDITSPLPYFIGKGIDYLGLHKDRLVIASGAVVFMSRPGDYFNWFKQSILDVADNDPIELYALGSEDDTIVAATTYDKSLILFGKKKQYVIPGKAVLSPKSATIDILSSHENIVDATPLNSGDVVFYAKGTEGTTSVHQIQAGVYEGSANSVQISQQLDKYIVGSPVELVAITAPNNLFVRTTASRNQLYVYTYLNAPNGERVFDSWSRWTWHSRLGSITGISRNGSGVLVYMLRNGLDRDGNHKTWIAAEFFTTATSTSKLPYFDSIRPASTLITPDANSFINPNGSAEDGYIAFGEDQGTKRFIGTSVDGDALELFLEQYPTAPDTAYIGVDFPAYVIPTNPYMKDREGKVIVVGKLTLTRLIVSVADTGGLIGDVTTSNGTYRTANFAGRVLGRSTNLIGQQPVVTTGVSMLVGQDAGNCTYKLSAATFLPLTITAIEWVGQYFNNTRRV